MQVKITNPTSPQTSILGKVVQVAGDLYSRVVTTMGTLIAGEDIAQNRMLTEKRWSTAIISSATTTTVLPGAGVFGGIIVNQTGTGTLTIYDNTAASGTIIAVLSQTIGEYNYDRTILTGITVVSGSTTAGVTVKFRADV